MCNSVDGQCSCRANVMGRRCDTCKESTFGLVQHVRSDLVVTEEDVTIDEKDEGCTPCFCFGRSSSCTQAQLIWTQVGNSIPQVFFR